jgi:hypothetical protein
MATLFVDKIDPQSGTSLEIGSSGDTITIPSGATITNNGTQTGFGGANTPAFFAHSASAQTSLTDNTYTKVTLGTEVFDVGACFASSRFTVPSGEAGKYFFYGSIRCETDTNDELYNSYSSFYLNGSQYIENRMSFQNNPIRFATNLNHVVMDLSVGDYVELYGAIDTSSGGRQFGASSKGTSFGGYKIIE